MKKTADFIRLALSISGILINIVLMVLILKSWCDDESADLQNTDAE